MTLGDKIYQLRKERGLSQEALAEQLGATRQAVSKWETNQGFPETEKLLRLSSILGVSTDFLLKDEQTARSAEAGYYVSREMAAGFLANTRQVCRYLGAGFFCWAITGVPYVLLRDIPELRLFGMAFFVVLGVILVVLAMFTEQESYRVLQREPLLFDYAYLRELTEEYRVRKRKYTVIAVPSTILFVLGVLALAYTARGVVPWSALHVLIFLGWAAGLLGFVYALGMMESYELLVHNDQYASRTLFRLRRRLRQKL